MIAMQKVHSFATAFEYNDKKLQLREESQRAEVLDHNFLAYDKHEILKDIKMLNRLNSKVRNDGYHVALSFSEKDNHLTNSDLIAIADSYKKGMGFNDDHLFVLYKHNDGEDHKHIHVHLLLHRLSIDKQGKVKVVSDSNNYRRSEAICRELEIQFNLEKARSSKYALDRSPTKDELEMIQRTGRPSFRMVMQEKVKISLSKSYDIESFINNCKEQSIFLLFNQSDRTGRVSGITYIDGESSFIATGQKLGNQFKWKNLSNQLEYGKQSRDGEKVSQSNLESRARFKDLLEGRTGKNLHCYSSFERETRSEHQNSERYNSSTSGTQYQEGGSRTDSDRTEGFEKGERKAEESISDRLFVGSSTLISSFGRISNNHSSEELEEEKKKRKRKR